MRIMGIFMILVAVVSYADSSLLKNSSEKAETGDVPPLTGRSVLFDQAYTGVIDTALRSGGLYLNADDFVLTEAGQVESIECWSIFVGGQDGSFYLRIYSNYTGCQNVPSTPGDILWEIPAASAVNTDTGDDLFGNDIYHTEIVLDSSDYFAVESNTVYWFSIYYNEENYYWGILEEGGLMCHSYDSGDWTTHDSVCFFRLNGTPSQALEATTWAAIKTGF